jgi:hypothetical protein
MVTTRKNWGQNGDAERRRKRWRMSGRRSK